MIYSFDTTDKAAATGALLIYAIYRSRDSKRYKASKDMWAQIERFVKASAKRAETLQRFIEVLKPKLCCDTLMPWAMKVGLTGDITLIRVTNSDGLDEFIQPKKPEDQREFLTQPLAEIEHRAVLNLLYKETAWIVLLVRTRLEAEKPLESRFNTTLDALHES